MKRALALALAVAAVAALAIAAGAATAAPAKKQDTTLSGAGSSFVFPLVSKWIPALGSAYGFNVSYSPIGSGGGIAAITARTVDFGASDAPLTPDQLTACKGCVQIPWALSATAIAYNLPGANCVVRLTRADPRRDLSRRDHELERRGDHEDQPEVHAARSTKITPVYRSDNSGHVVQLHRLPRRPSARRGSRSSASARAQWPAGVGRERQLGRRRRDHEDRGRDRLRRRRLRAAEQAPLRLDAQRLREVRDARACAASRRRLRRCRRRSRATARSRSSTRRRATRSPTRSRRSPT